MIGNVDEWVNDYYCKDYYKVCPPKDPSGPKQTDTDIIKRTNTDWRIARGGSYASYKAACGLRAAWPMDEKNPMGVGFRVVITNPLTKGSLNK